MSVDWPEVSIEEIAAQQPNALATGPFGSAISSKFFVAKGVPVIRGSNLSTDIGIKLNDEGLVFVSEEKAKTFSRSIVKRGDLIFTCWGTINQVGMIHERSRWAEHVISNKQMKLTVDPLKADPKFIYYVFSSPTKHSEILANSIGAAVPGFNLGQLQKHTFNLPPLRTQRNIVNSLDLLDRKIQLNHQTNQTLEQMAQAIFKSWFVDFEPVKAKIAALETGGSEADALLAAMRVIAGDAQGCANATGGTTPGAAKGDKPTRLQAEQPEQYAELRATAELFPSAMQDSELGEIPEGWRQRQVGELATIKGGKQRSRDLISNIGPVPVFGGAGIMGYTDEHNADGFVISVGRVGAYCGQFFSHRGPSWVNNNASLIRPSNINHGEWLFISLQNIDLAPIKKGAAQPFVSNSDLAKLQVVWPGDMVIEKFTQQLRNLFLLQETLLQQSDSLSTLRDTLLPELLAGRLDTSVIGS